MYQHVNAHDDCINSCDWGVMRTRKRNGGDDDDDTAAAADRKDDGGDGKLLGATSDCIVTASMDNTVKTWIYDGEANELTLDKTFDEITIGFVSVAFNSDASIVAASTLDSVLMLWNTTTGVRINKFQYELLELWKIAFSPDGNYIITGSHMGEISSYCVETGVLKRVFNTRGILRREFQRLAFVFD